MPETGEDQHAPVTYSSYLGLDRLLSAQNPRSDEHDELLFIVVHQVYELWFKQLLHELGRLQRRLGEGDTSRSLHTLRRILTILKVAVAQIDVLETMTPRQFTGFRARLDSSSGFQSAQFRRVEAVLGRRDPSVLDHYPPGSAEHDAIAAAMGSPSLYDSFAGYLAVCGYRIPEAVRDRDVTEPVAAYPEMADTLVEVYRDDSGPSQVAERLVDLDEAIQEWRYRHVKMVERTIGDKIGTGGSSGAGYLRSTLFNPVFPDLWAIRSRL